MFDELEILDWLTKVENMDSEDAIERVNKKVNSFFQLICFNIEIKFPFFIRCSRDCWVK